MRRFDNPLHKVLHALSTAVSLVPDNFDRDVIRQAADIVQRDLPDARILITGPDQLTDPVTAELLNILDDWSRLYDSLAVLEDRTSDLARQLRKHPAEEES